MKKLFLTISVFLVSFVCLIILNNLSLFLYNKYEIYEKTKFLSENIPDDLNKNGIFDFYEDSLKENIKEYQLKWNNYKETKRHLELSYLSEHLMSFNFLDKNKINQIASSWKTHYECAAHFSKKAEPDFLLSKKEKHEIKKRMFNLSFFLKNFKIESLYRVNDKCCKKITQVDGISFINIQDKRDQCLI